MIKTREKQYKPPKILEVEIHYCLVNTLQICMSKLLTLVCLSLQILFYLVGLKGLQGAFTL